jgi:hypothetical protein
MRVIAMDTPHTETVVDKAVAYVKEVLGIHPDTHLDGEGHEYHDAARDITAENAMRLDPLVVNPGGEIPPNSYVRPLGHPEDERIRRVIDGERRERMVKLNRESGRVEE